MGSRLEEVESLPAIISAATVAVRTNIVHCGHVLDSLLLVCVTLCVCVTRSFAMCMNFTLTQNINIPLYKKLREQLLVQDNLDAILSTFYNKKRVLHQLEYCSQLLYRRLNDTIIIVDFSNFMRQSTVITEQGMETILFYGQFSESRPTLGAPYTGAFTNYRLSTLLDPA